MKRIILVDDEPMMLKIAERALKDSYETATASSGDEALSKFAEGAFDMVISDLKMPGMSGYELQDKVKELYGDHIPFIFMTADDTIGESADKMKGAAAYIKKPVRADALQSAVANVFEGKESVPVAAVKPAETPGDEKEKLPEWLLHEPLIDIDAGLTNSESAENYLGAIQIFMDHVDGNIKELEGYFSVGDMENYTIKSHGLKSTSRIIGAMVLSSLAYSMERAGMDKNYDFIKAEHEGFIALYRKYQSIILSHEDNSGKEELPEEDFQEALMAMKEYAMSEEYSLLEDMIGMLQKYALPPEASNLVSEIKQGMMNLDWDRINQLLDKN